MAHDPKTGAASNIAARALIPAYIQAFAIGFVAKSVINLVSIAVAKHKHGKWLSALDWRFGVFLAAFSGGWKGILCLLRRWRHKDDSWNAVIAGSVASLSLRIAQPEDRATFALYAFVRACEFVGRHWMHSGNAPTWMSTFQHYDVLLMGLAAREVLYCYVFEPQHLNSAYLRFLQKHGGTDLRGLKLLVQAQAHGTVDMPALSSYMTKTGGSVARALLPTDPVPLTCEVIHPGKDCFSHKFSFFYEGMKRSVVVYAPLHAVFSLVLFFRSKHIDLPHFMRIVQKWLSNTTWSSAFLAAYCTFAWIAFCIWARTHRSMPLLKLALIGCGLTTLLDHKSRRMELAMYCVPKALEAQYSRYVSYGRIPHVKYGEYPLFALAAAGIVYSYHKRSEHGIKGTLKSVLGWMWGQC